MPTANPTLHLGRLLADHSRDMSGRIAVITGTTSGTGHVCARELAKLGATVVLLNRASTRAQASLKQLQDAVPTGKFDAISCDLQQFASVRAAAALLRERYDRIDVLCNNAGVMALPPEVTADGYDVQMQTNCLSHFLLTRELWPLLLKSDDGRVVNHSSMARLGAPLEARYFAKVEAAAGPEPEGDGPFSGPRWQRYHQTKLANCAFTYELKRRLDARGIKNIKALLAHPGLAATNLQPTTADTGGMDMGDPGVAAFMSQAQSPEDGATGILRCCMDPAAVSGDFYGPPGFAGFPDKIEPEPLLLDAENLRIHWEGAEAAVGAFEI